jgi:hypothetical protein
VVITGDGSTRVYFKAVSPNFEAEFPKGYTWSVLFGNQCAVSDCYLRPRHAKCGE